MENGPFEDVFPRKKWGYCIAMLVYQRVVQFYSNTSFAGLQQHCLIETHTPKELSGAQSAHPLFQDALWVGWSHCFDGTFFLNDLNCQKQKRSDICRWTLPDTFFIEHQYIMAKPDLKVGLLTQIMSCIGINLHIVICIS